MPGIVEINHNDRIKGFVDKFKAVDLFPYKIKDVNAFYHRDHPYWDEFNSASQEYWQSEIRRCAEGLWVEDSGDWVYMMPKLYTYINHGKVALTEEDEDGNEDRVMGAPSLMHLEWVFQTLIECNRGFAGFVGDEQISCYLPLKRYFEGHDPKPKEAKLIQKYCKKPNGDLKDYVDPWEYLTRFYLVDNPQKKPLGRTIYTNPITNLMAITSRDTHKSYNIAADFWHEFMLNGAKNYDQVFKDRKIQIFAGAASTLYLNNFFEIAYDLYRALSGTEEIPPSPLYRATVGPWDADPDPIEQKFIQQGLKEYQGTFSTVAKAIFTGRKAALAAVSKRAVLAIVDEAGRIPELQSVYGALVNILKTQGSKFGRANFTGTGGDIEVTLDTEYMFTHPRLYKIYPIPNYWKSFEEIGLFISFADTLKEFRDDNGNIDILASTKKAVELRKEREALDSSQRASQTLIDATINEPLDPTEPFKISQMNLFDQKRITERIATVERLLWKEKAKVVDLHISDSGEVTYREVPQKMYNVFKHIDRPSKDVNVGEVVMIEPPMNPDNEIKAIGSKYKIVYDPVSDKPDGPSYASIKVWKGGENNLFSNELSNTVVAYFKGRREDPDEDHLICLMLSVLYNAPVLYENQVSGVLSVFNRYGMANRLIYPPLELIRNINPTAKRPTSPGMTMNDKLKYQGIRRWNKIMNTPVHRDTEGKPFTYIDLMYDLSALYEMNFYEKDGNYDDISAFAMLALWLNHEANYLAMYGELDEDVEQETEFDELELVAFALSDDIYG